MSILDEVRKLAEKLKKAKQRGVSNIRGNVKALSRPKTRKQWVKGVSYQPRKTVSKVRKWRQQREPNVIGGKLVERTGPVGQMVAGIPRGTSGYLVDKESPVYRNVPEPKSFTGKAGRTLGELGGFALGPGKAFYAPIEAATSKFVGPTLGKLPSLAKRIGTAATAEAASSAAFSPIRSLIKGEPLGEAFGKEYTAGLTGRAAFAPLALAAGGLKSKIDADKLKKSIPDLRRLINSNQRYDSMRPFAQINAFQNAKRLTEELMPNLAKNREMKRLETARPRQWLNTVAKFAEDRLAQAKSPELKFGLGTRELKTTKGKFKAPKGEEDFRVLDRISSGFKEARKLRKMEGDIPLKSKLKSQWLDRFSPAEKFDENFFLNLRLLSGGGSARQEQIIKENLGPILQREGNRLEGFSQLLTLDRMDELVNTRGIERSFTPEDIKKGHQELELKYGRDTIRQMRQSASQLRGFLDKTLDMAVRSGLISEKGAEAARNKNQFYVTFETLGQLARDVGKRKYRAGTNSFNSARQSVLKKIGKSTTDIADPLESTLAKVQRTIFEADKNAVLKDFVDNNPDVAKKISASADPSGNRGAVNVFKNGEKLKYEVPKDIERVVKNLDAKTLGWLERITTYPTKVLKTGAVYLNPEFFLINPVRDIQDALVGEGAKVNNKEAMKLLGNYTKALSETAGMGDQWAAWRKAGGAYSTFLRAEIRKKPEVSVERLAKQAEKRIDKKVMAVIKKPGKIFDFLSRTGEESTRLAKFKKDIGKKAVKATKGTKLLTELPGDVRRAAFESREITLDFAKMGTISRVLNRYIPFFNVGVIGTEKFAKLIKNNPVKAAKSAATFIGIPATAIYLWNRRFNDYKDLGKFEKRSNFVIMLRDRTPKEKREEKPLRAVKIRIGNLAKPFYNTWSSFLDYVGQTNPQKLDQLALNLLEDISPVGVPLPGERGRQFIGNITPQFIKPSVEAVANRNLYTGYNIEPGWQEGVRRRNIPEGLRASKYTGPTARILGRFTGPTLGLSPADVQNLAGTAFGGVGKNFLTLSDSLLGEGPKDITKVPMARRVFGAYGGREERERWEKQETIQKKIGRTQVKTSNLLKQGKISPTKEPEQIFDQKTLQKVDEKTLQNMDQYAGFRAIAIKQKLDSLESDQERARLWDEYVDKEIITEYIARQMKQDFDTTDAVLKGMGVKDGSRAMAIRKQLAQLETQEEKARLWDEYVAKRIITKDVAKQLKGGKQ